MDGGAWWATVHRVAKSQTWLFFFHECIISNILERVIIYFKFYFIFGSLLKSRDIILPIKVHLLVFPVVMYECESWTIKKAECWRIDAFELWCWRRLLRIPWTARRSNQSIVKEITRNIHWKDCCSSWNFNTLATWCKELTHWKRPWCWRRLKARGEGDNKGWDGWMASLTLWTWVWASSGSWWWTGKPGMFSPRGRKELDMTEQPT